MMFASGTSSVLAKEPGDFMVSRLLRSTFSTLWLFMMMLALSACSDGRDDYEGNGGSGLPQADNPVVEGPVTGGGGPDCCIVKVVIDVDLRDQGYQPGTPFFSNVQFDLAELGYQQSEYFISGTAKSYINTSELDAAGNWSVAQADAAAYRSRIAIARPINPEDFNGTVIVEWFNNSGGLDAAPDWLALQTEIMRSGYVWVGVSAQRVGVQGGGGAFDISLQDVDPVRYGSLFHPGDSFAYDIYSQAAQSVKNPVGLDPLEGLQVERMIGVGQSQSAFYLSTYVNAIHPTIDLFDGFLIHSRANYSAKLSQEPQADISTPENVFIRTDLTQPVITLQAETDVFRLGSIAIRQADSDYFRLWEMAAAAHSDIYTTLKSPIDKGDDPALTDVTAVAEVRPPFITCDVAANDGSASWIAKAAMDALNRWIRDGDAAASAPLLAVNPAGTDFVLDEHGNVEGGIRTHYVDAPVATFGGIGQGNEAFCGLFGTTVLFDQAKLNSLYPTNDDYVTAINEAADAAVAARFLLEADAALIKARAPESGIGGP